jgi:predicted DNA-binding protein (UPF0251 family)
MSRPPKCRWVGQLTQGIVFKPRGVPLRNLELVVLQLDELEALRQAHLEGKSQEEGAEILGISRSTFGRILENAHQKITTALVHHQALQIEGGPIIMEKRQFQCRDCGNTWEVAFGTGRPDQCPSCNSQNFNRTDAGPRQRGCCQGGSHPRGHGKGQKLN